MSAEPRVETSPPVLFQDFRLHSFDVDFRQRASPETICRFFLEAAWNHAERLGVGFEILQQENRVWVLSRLLVQIRQYPTWGQNLTVRTWPRTERSVFAMRDYRLFGPDGQELASGASAWLLIDSKTRKPQRMDRVAARIGPASTERATERDPQKLSALPVDQPGLNIKARYSDLDVNDHVNSCRYIGWLLDCYPHEWHATHRVTSLEVNYLGETRDGDVLGLGCDLSLPDGHMYSLMSLKDRREVCRARLNWEAEREV